MTEKIIALFVAGVLHFWNPTGEPQIVTLKTADNSVIIYSAAPLSEITVPFNGANQVVTVTSDVVRSWFTAQEVPFEAVKVAVRWEIPVHKGTGIVIANPNNTPAMLAFSIGDAYTNGQLIANTSFGLFAATLFNADIDGTLVITTSITTPITVAASQCTATCQSLSISN